nr:Uncharacterised protein [Klebsiella pneumoniae]
MPAIKLPALCGQRRFAPALFVVAAGACSFPGTRITRLSPFAGADKHNLSCCPGTAGPFAINFPGHSAAASLGRKNFPLTPDICTGPCSFTPLRRTALKRVKVISGGRFSRSPHKVKTAAPATQRVMVLKDRKQTEEKVG